MSRAARVAASVALACLVLTSCGSRVVPLSQGQNGLSTDGNGAGGQAQPSGGGPIQSGTAAPTTGGSSGAAPGSSGGPERTVQDNCRGGATDIGVTAKTIKLGLIASLTGPLPGQFDSAVEATDSYVRLLNDQGGICGRKIDLIIRDDHGDGGTDLAVARKLAEEDKVFAFVGSVSAPDDSGIAKVSKEKKIPDIGFPLSWERAENPYTYGAPGQLQRRTIGEGASGSMYLNRVNGIKQIAIFWLKESEVSILNAWAFETAMMRTSNNGVKICHEQPAGVLDANFGGYVLSMQGKCDPNDGPIAVYSTMENNANIKLAIAMKEQGFKPKVFAPTFSSYLPTFIDQAGGATEGAYLAMPQIPFERLSAPQSAWTPGTYELKRYIDTLKRYHPRHKAPGSFGGSGWGNAALFAEAARTCGAALTRACLFKQLDTMGPFSANGLLSPTTPSNHHIYTNDLIVQVRNGRFTEIRPEDKSGPAGGPDFWDRSTLFDWQVYMCANEGKFPNMTEKKKYLSAC